MLSLYGRDETIRNVYRLASCVFRTKMTAVSGAT